MEKVFLRVYDREIEGMIEAGQLDEAIAHCQHILKTYPMHVETYRLLGKAFLEAKRYSDAADIFQRVLMAVPDDFVSQVGMSIIRDDEGKLDDAIWHMERAYEVQPSNSAIQGELRRLYGRRDGVEPSKIRLSRDALANMYSQGELFNQAIAEIRSVLAEDPDRPDLQVMLMRAYYRSGQKVEAAEMSATLLNKYPYCLDALRVLVELLPGTARAENTQVYSHRLLLLDPYSSSAVDNVFATDQVKDSAVSLERLDYKAGAVPMPVQPDWASSLGIKLDSEVRKDLSPEWLQSPETPEKPITPPSETPAGTSELMGVTTPGDVPDWMRSAGWTETSAGEEQSALDEAGEIGPEEPIAKAEIPDWLKAIAPAGSKDETPTAFEEASEPLPVGEDGIPKWLKPKTTSEPINGESEDFKQEAAQQPEESLPERMEPADSQPSMEVTKESADQNEPGLLSDATIVSKITTESIPNEKPILAVELETPEVEISSTEADASLGWQPGVGDRGVAAASVAADFEKSPEMESQSGIEQFTSEPTASEPPAPMEPQVKEREATPESTSDEVIESFQPSGEGKLLDISDDALGWLENLAAKQGAKPEELLTNPEQRSIDMPDWLRQPTDTVEENAEAPVRPPSETPAEPLPVEPPVMQPEPPISTEDLTFAETIPQQVEASIGETPSENFPREAEQSASTGADSISWLKGLSTPSLPETEAGEVTHEDLPELDESGQGFGEGQESQSQEEPVPPGKSAIEEDITITNWLSRLDVEEALGKRTENVLAGETPAEPVEELPDWLKDLEKSTIKSKVVQPGDDFPDWLREPITAEKTESVAGDEIPAWIDENAAAADAIIPTAPEEWLPNEIKVEEEESKGIPGEIVPPVEVPEITEPVPGEESSPSAATSPLVEAEPIIEQPPQVEPISFSATKSFEPPTLKQTGMLSQVPPMDKDAELLSGAQSILSQNSLNDAMKLYLKLIKKGRLLDEVIHDLREAIYRYPVDVIIWQTLGDAYMRANRLQDALDAYTKAEELLR